MKSLQIVKSKNVTLIFNFWIMSLIAIESYRRERWSTSTIISIICLVYFLFKRIHLGSETLFSYFFRIFVSTSEWRKIWSRPIKNLIFFSFYFTMPINFNILYRYRDKYALWLDWSRSNCFTWNDKLLYRTVCHGYNLFEV